MPVHSAANPVKIAIVGAGAASDYHHVPDKVMFVVPEALATGVTTTVRVAPVPVMEMPLPSEQLPAGCRISLRSHQFWPPPIC